MAKFVDNAIIEPNRFYSPFSIHFRSFEEKDPDYDFAAVSADLIGGVKTGRIETLKLDYLHGCLENVRRRGIIEEREKRGMFTAAELSCIFLLTEPLADGETVYNILNTALRVPRREGLSGFLRFMYLLMHGLKKCPRFEGPELFHGALEDASQKFEQEKQIVLHQFLTWTSNRDELIRHLQEENSEFRTFFTLSLRTGRARSLHQFGHFLDHEYVIPPSLKVLVKRVHFEDGITYVYLEEIPSDDYIVNFECGEIKYIPPPPLPDLSVESSAQRQADYWLSKLELKWDQSPDHTQELRALHQQAIQGSLDAWNQLETSRDLCGRALFAELLHLGRYNETPPDSRRAAEIAKEILHDLKELSVQRNALATRCLGAFDYFGIGAVHRNFEGAENKFREAFHQL